MRPPLKKRVCSANQAALFSILILDSAPLLIKNKKLYIKTTYQNSKIDNFSF
jgi:hypothetical protein